MKCRTVRRSIFGSSTWVRTVRMQTQESVSPSWCRHSKSWNWMKHHQNWVMCGASKFFSIFMQQCYNRNLSPSFSLIHVCVHVCVCVWDREREFECVCVCVCVHACMYVCVHACVCIYIYFCVCEVDHNKTGTYPHKRHHCSILSIRLSREITLCVWNNAKTLPPPPPHHLSPVIFANTTVMAFVLLHSSWFNFHSYTEHEPTPHQKLSPEVAAATFRSFLLKRLQRAFTHANQPCWIAR